MIITWQAVVILSGVDALMQPSWPVTIFFLIALFCLATSERRLDEREKAQNQSAAPDHPSQFNEDHPDWDT